MDIAVLGGLIFRRYYDGGKRTAYELAVRHNRNIQIEYQNKLLPFDTADLLPGFNSRTIR
jgi:hypothetical protein